MANRDKVVLITGASSGIGLACATHLYQRGYRVFGGSRRAPSASFEVLRMDVDSDASVQSGVEAVLAREQRLDVAVNCAGFAIAGAIEDTSIQEARAQLETNFFGALRVCRSVLPVMRAQGQGTIVNVSSIGGLIGLPFQGCYSASKFALEGMSESLRTEVRPFGIRVVLIEPGNFATSITSSRRVVSRARRGSAYEESFNRCLATIEADERAGPDPGRIAHLLERVIASPSPRLRYTVGLAAERAAAALSGVLPAWLVEWGVTKMYGLG